MNGIFEAESTIKLIIVITLVPIELPLLMKVQKQAFESREDGALLEEGGNASVHYWYTRTYNVSERNIPRKHKFDPYSKPNKDPALLRYQSLLLPILQG